MSPPPRLLTVLAAVVVGGVWVGSLVVGTVEHDWTPFATATPLAALVCGYAFQTKNLLRQHDKDA